MKLYIAFKLENALELQVQQLILTHCHGRQPLIPTPIDRIHVTTLFLGEMGLESVKDILDYSVRGIKPFRVRVGCPTILAKGKAAILPVYSLTLEGKTLSVVRTRQAQQFQILTGKIPWPTVYEPHVTLAKTETGTALEQVLNVVSAAAAFKAADSMVTALGIYHKSELLYEVQL